MALRWSAGKISRFLAPPAVLLAIASLAGCDVQVAQPAKTPLNVTVETAAYVDYSRSVSLTGVIRPVSESSLSFRTAGRIITRDVDLGDHVEAGELLAAIDASEQEANLRAAEATLQSADAVLTQASAAFERQKSLLSQGISTRTVYDTAEETLRTAQQSVQAAQAQRDTAWDALSFTEIRAPSRGIITDRNADVGQVVQPAQAIFKLAEDGPRDAVFNVYESILTDQPKTAEVRVSLASNPAVSTVGTVREVSPTVDQRTGTVQAKMALKDTPAGMTLGSTVIGTASMRPARAMVLPWTALSSINGAAAVWVVDPKTAVVSLKKVDVLQYNGGTIVISGGLDDGELVVAQGAKLLRPGQVVKFSEKPANG